MRRIMFLGELHRVLQPVFFTVVIGLTLLSSSVVWPDYEREPGVWTKFLWGYAFPVGFLLSVIVCFKKLWVWLAS